MKTCPYCAEEIQDEAIKCRYCNETLINKEQHNNSPKAKTQTEETYEPQLSLGFNEAVSTCFQKYFDFSGRARGSEYWYFFTFGIIVEYAALVLDIYLFGYGWEDFGPLYLISSLGLFIPTISAGARRLHDSNKSGWRQLWILTGIGAFFLLYWLIIKGETDKNSYDIN